jgi:FkbM family methyltransferase
MFSARSLARPLEILSNAVFTSNGRRNAAYRWRRWRLRTFTPFGQGRPAVYRLRGGRRFVVHPGDRLSMGIADNRRYEWLESRVLEQVLRPGDIAIDVGANIGYYTALFSACVGSEGKVFAFEPGPGTYSKLKDTIALLGLANVDARCAALSERSGIQAFVASTSGHDAQQSLADWEGFSGDKAVTHVEAVTLDGILADALPASRAVAVFKCDVEGAETKVLAGANALLSGPNPPVLMIEANRKALAAHGTELDSLLRLLLGYRLYYTPLDEPGRAVQAFRVSSELPDLANIFAFPLRGAFADRIASNTLGRYLSDGGVPRGVPAP